MLLWEAETEKHQQILRGHRSWVFIIAYRPDNKQLATGACDNTIGLWDTTTGQCQHILKGHTHLLSAVAYRPDGKQLATASYDRTVRLWNMRSKKLLNILDLYSGLLFAAAYQARENNTIITLSAAKHGRLCQAYQGLLGLEDPEIMQAVQQSLIPYVKINS